jgi:hypothetical protein
LLSLVLIDRSALFGLLYMLPILFTLGDLDTILASVTGQPLPEMFLQATGSQGAAFGLFFIGKPHYLALRYFFASPPAD